MEDQQKEDEHTISILEQAKQAIRENDANKLNDLSNQKIHSICCVQDVESITLTIVLYALSKLIERREKLKLKNWNKFIKKLNSYLDIAIKSIKQNNHKKYRNSILKTRKIIESLSIDLKPYIMGILQKASVNKASRVYEHGLSLGQTAKLLGLTNWELSEYMGQERAADNNLNETLEVKKRAKMALEFFE